MSNTHLRLDFVGETLFPPRTPFFSIGRACLRVRARDTELSSREADR